MLPIKIELPEGFLEEEVRCGYTVSAEMKKLWAVELDLLAEFDRVCKKHGITYFVDGGTLLGTIRHQGFIPWDDDVDLVMLREEYEKLLKIVDQEFQHPYFFQTTESDPGLIMGGSRLRNSETTLVSDFKNKRPYKNKGIFIDIYVLDKVPDSKRKIKGIRRVLKMYWRILRYAAYYESYFCSGKKTSAWQKIVGKISLMLKSVFGITGLCKGYEAYCAHWNHTDTDLIASLKSNRGYVILRKEWYSEIHSAQFESLEVPIPNGYKEFLVEMYGEDYHVLKRQPSTHRPLAFDAETPYREYRIKNKKRGFP